MMIVEGIGPYKIAVKSQWPTTEQLRDMDIPLHEMDMTQIHLCLTSEHGQTFHLVGKIMPCAGRLFEAGARGKDLLAIAQAVENQSAYEMLLTNRIVQLEEENGRLREQITPTVIVEQRSS